LEIVVIAPDIRRSGASRAYFGADMGE